jgi:hypothetical protein
VCEAANGVQFLTAKVYSFDCKKEPNVRYVNNGLGPVLDLYPSTVLKPSGAYEN